MDEWAKGNIDFYEVYIRIRDTYGQEVFENMLSNSLHILEINDRYENNKTSNISEELDKLEEELNKIKYSEIIFSHLNYNNISELYRDIARAEEDVKYYEERIYEKENNDFCIDSETDIMFSDDIEIVKSLLEHSQIKLEVLQMIKFFTEKTNSLEDGMYQYNKYITGRKKEIERQIEQIYYKYPDERVDEYIINLDSTYLACVLQQVNSIKNSQEAHKLLRTYRSYCVNILPTIRSSNNENITEEVFSDIQISLENALIQKLIELGIMDNMQNPDIQRLLLHEIINRPINEFPVYDFNVEYYYGVEGDNEVLILPDHNAFYCKYTIDSNGTVAKDFIITASEYIFSPVFRMNPDYKENEIKNSEAKAKLDGLELEFEPIEVYKANE